MNPQRKRLNGESQLVTTLDVNNESRVLLDFDNAPAVNIHGMRYCASIEPENTDANCNGFWMLFCLPGGVLDVTNDLPKSWAGFDNEDFMPYLWGVGCFTASNQAPYHFEYAPKTSRTCQNGARVVGYCVMTGISAGSVRVNSFLQCFTSS